MAAPRVPLGPDVVFRRVIVSLQLRVDDQGRTYFNPTRPLPPVAWSASGGPWNEEELLAGATVRPPPLYSEDRWTVLGVAPVRLNYVVPVAYEVQRDASTVSLMWTESTEPGEFTWAVPTARVLTKAQLATALTTALQNPPLPTIGTFPAGAATFSASTNLLGLDFNPRLDTRYPVFSAATARMWHALGFYSRRMGAPASAGVYNAQGPLCNPNAHFSIGVVNQRFSVAQAPDGRVLFDALCTVPAQIPLPAPLSTEPPTGTPHSVALDGNMRACNVRYEEMEFVLRNSYGEPAAPFAGGPPVWSFECDLALARRPPGG